MEAASLGARPAVTTEGGAVEYLGFEAEYLNPVCSESIRQAVERAWDRGRLDARARSAVQRFTWDAAAGRTVEAYVSAWHALCPHVTGRLCEAAGPDLQNALGGPARR